MRRCRRGARGALAGAGTSRQLPLRVPRPTRGASSNRLPTRRHRDLPLLAAACSAPEDRGLTRPRAVSQTPFAQRDVNVDGLCLRSLDEGPREGEVVVILPGHTALLDRLLHKSHVLNIRGRSYRLRDLEKMLK